MGRILSKYKRDFIHQSSLKMRHFVVILKKNYSKPNSCLFNIATLKMGFPFHYTARDDLNIGE